MSILYIATIYLMINTLSCTHTSRSQSTLYACCTAHIAWYCTGSVASGSIRSAGVLHKCDMMLMMFVIVACAMRAASVSYILKIITHATLDILRSCFSFLYTLFLLVINYKIFYLHILVNIFSPMPSLYEISHSLTIGTYLLRHIYNLARELYC